MAADTIRSRREALGWTRAELARRAQVDRSVLQLLELSLSADTETAARCEAALTEGEAEVAAEADLADPEA